MTKSKVEDAERMALNILDEWNSVTGVFDTNASYWCEIKSIIEDAVHIGIQMSVNGFVKKDESGDLIKEK